MSLKNSAHFKNRKATVEKIRANNAVYMDFMKLCAFAKVVFRKDEALKNQFVFSNLLAIVKRNEVTGKGLNLRIVDGAGENGLDRLEVA